jgi:hypothetical protein
MRLTSIEKVVPADIPTPTGVSVVSMSTVTAVPAATFAGGCSLPVQVTAYGVVSGESHARCRSPRAQRGRHR